MWDALGLFGLTPPVLILPLPPAPPSPGQIYASMKMGVLKSEFDSTWLYTGTGLNSFLATLESRIMAINITMSSWVGNKYWPWPINLMNLEPDATEDSVSHELIHAYVDGSLPAISDEGMAYTWNAVLYQAAWRLAEIETLLKREDCDNVKVMASSLWRAAWGQFGDGADYSDNEGMYYPGAISFPLTASDVTRIKNTFGFHLYCPLIAGVYSIKAMEKGCCLEFSCDYADTSPVAIKPACAVKPVYLSP